MATQTQDVVVARDAVHDVPPGVRPPQTWGAVLRYLGIAIALAYALFPILFIVSSAFNPSGTLTTTSLIPKGASLVNFTDLFAIRPYWSWYKNSLIIAGFCTVASVLIGAMAAYAFSRLRFQGRRPGLLALLLVQMFPALLTFVALFTIFNAVGDVIPQLGFNTSAGLILAYLGGAMGANVWLLKGYFDTVPREIDEAAIVDGASHARIFFTMHLRLITPILITVGIISFIGLYQEFLLASIFLKDVDSQTLAVGLYALNEADKNKYFGPFCAGALLASIPAVVIYLLGQKQLIGGMTAGSVK
jgi:arabinogalactan oligomer/maltooligosaccharide transport system permease protein